MSFGRCRFHASANQLDAHSGQRKDGLKFKNPDAVCCESREAKEEWR
jgi:hypothetical protein